jgi:hypothetical protein
MAITKATASSVAPAAKGDLVVGSGTNDAAVLAVGTNGDTLVADSAATVGLRYQANFAAGKNKIINGDFAVNQRSFSSRTTDGYGHDRWYMLTSDGTTTYSTQTFTAGTAPVTGYEGINFARLVSSGQTLAGAYSILEQRIEDVRTFANQTVTISFWAKASSGTPSIAINLIQNFGSGGSTAVNNYPSTIKTAITTSWARYSTTINVASVSGKTIGTSSYLDLRFWTSAGSTYNANTDTLGIQSATIDFWGVQVEPGSVATAFQTATGTLQGELAACQRYYIRYKSEDGSTNNPTFNLGQMVSTTTFRFVLPFPTAMRVKPSAVEYSGFRLNSGATQYTSSAITIDQANTLNTQLNVAITSGPAAGTAAWLIPGSGSSTDYLGLSAEL